ncbi:MAG: ABC transporter permease, partial [Beijerinckiaceae bacterium]
RCDRVAFMDQGRILAVAPPAELIAQTGAATLEDAFIAVLEKARGGKVVQPEPEVVIEPDWRPRPWLASWRRLFATAKREFRELARDPIRLGYAAFAAGFLLIVLGHGISMDVDRIPFAVLDQDQTPASRGFAQELAGSRYFIRNSDPQNDTEAERMLASRQVGLLLEIPAGYGRALVAGKGPEVGLWIDGASPGRAETVRSYALSLHQEYLRTLAEREPMRRSVIAAPEVEVRFRYNPDVKSAIAFAPGCIGILLMLTPAMLMAVAVTREKELGSILNLYTTPLRVTEFLLGKQLPYLLIGLVNFAVLYALTRIHFGVPFTGSLVALTIAAGMLVVAATGFGLMISAFTKSQVAALTAAQILSIVPSVGYSGLVVPVASMEGGAWYVAHGFPASYFHQSVIGTFLKGLTLSDILPNVLTLLLFGVIFTSVALVLTRKQER